MAGSGISVRRRSAETRSGGAFGEACKAPGGGALPRGRARPRVLLGRARVSADGKTACASCHFARDWSADRRAFSTDARGALTSRYSPPILNSMGQPTLRWLGDRKTGADQAEGSLTGSLGFASKEAALARLGGSAAAAGQQRRRRPGGRRRAGRRGGGGGGGGGAGGGRRGAGGGQRAGGRGGGGAGGGGGPGARGSAAAFQKFGMVKGLLGRNEVGQARCRPTRGDQEGRRPLRVPRADAAQRGEDRALFPRRLGGQARSLRGADHGERAASAHARRCGRGRDRRTSSSR